MASQARHLVVVFGDQLNIDSAAIQGMDKKRDVIWMAEVDEEVSYVRSHKLRILFFFAAMRHFRDELKSKGYRVAYTEMGVKKAEDRGKNFWEVLSDDVRKMKVEKVKAVWPGDWRVKEGLEKTCKKLKVELEIIDDEHFLTLPSEFAAWAKGKKQLTMEHFYREVRKRYGYLMTKANKPEGGEWNYDESNRESFGKDGPTRGLKAPKRFKVDDVTKGVMGLIEKRFKDAPGELTQCEIAVTRKDAEAFLKNFIANRLPLFGKYEDAMWEGEAFLYHSRLSCLLNVKLLSPNQVIEAAIKAYREKKAGIESVEGFVRQVCGWREFMRGIYWLHMPRYSEMNALGCGDVDVPKCYWDGQTDMRCIGEAMKHVLEHGYAHHIERLMVLGLFAQLVGVHPMKFHEWHMGMYLDSIDWVSLPNVLGMSQWGDGGIVGSKPYCASGNYIDRMSNYCGNCRYKPKVATGEDACPVTTLYWDFLTKHEKKFEKNMRMKFQIANLKKKSAEEMKAIKKQAKDVRLRVLG